MYIGVIFVTAIRAVHVESRIFTTGVGYCGMVYIPTAILHGSGIMAVFNAGAYVDRSTQIFRNVEIQIRPEVISVEVGDIVSFEWRILIKNRRKRNNASIWYPRTFTLYCCCMEPDFIISSIQSTSGWV